jgi:hypothetical protein
MSSTYLVGKLVGPPQNLLVGKSAITNAGGLAFGLQLHMA